MKRGKRLQKLKRKDCGKAEVIGDLLLVCPCEMETTIKEEI
jgi:hypothetical protein